MVRGVGTKHRKLSGFKERPFPTSQICRLGGGLGSHWVYRGCRPGRVPFQKVWGWGGITSRLCRCWQSSVPGVCRTEAPVSSLVVRRVPLLASRSFRHPLAWGRLVPPSKPATPVKASPSVSPVPSVCVRLQGRALVFPPDDAGRRPSRGPQLSCKSLSPREVASSPLFNLLPVEKKINKCGNIATPGGCQEGCGVPVSFLQLFRGGEC